MSEEDYANDDLAVSRTDAATVNVKMELSDGFKEVQRLEAELRRRDRELIAEWRRSIADTRPKQIYGGAVIVPWSTVDAILSLLPTE